MPGYIRLCVSSARPNWFVQSAQGGISSLGVGGGVVETTLMMRLMSSVNPESVAGRYVYVSLSGVQLRCAFVGSLSACEGTSESEKGCVSGITGGVVLRSNAGGVKRRYSDDGSLRGPC